jgi:sugar phosphate isomerase/epimerase
MKYSRTVFLKALGLAGIAATTNILRASPLDNSTFPNLENEETSDLTLGLASYSTREYSLDETLAMAKRLNLKKIAVKSMHMPLESSEEEIAKILEKVNNAGLSIYGAGVIYMKTEEEVVSAFRYAKAAKLEMIIGVPNHELLNLVEMKVKETDIKLAIHNHGPGDEVYPTPEVVYNKIKSLDSRIGLCIDIGHVQRLELDPVENIKAYADRLYDMHLKDVDMVGAEGKSVEFGRGIINIPAVLMALKKINYTGVMAIEYEKDAMDVISGLSECVGYTHGVLDYLRKIKIG